MVKSVYDVEGHGFSVVWVGDGGFKSTVVACCFFVGNLVVVCHLENVWCKTWSVVSVGVAAPGVAIGRVGWVVGSEPGTYA